MTGKGEERGMTVIGSLYHRIQEVKSGAVMPWTGHTYSTGDIRFVDQQTLGQSMNQQIGRAHV